jgi:hypothetical protein
MVIASTFAVAVGVSTLLSGVVIVGKAILLIYRFLRGDQIKPHVRKIRSGAQRGLFTASMICWFLVVILLVGTPLLALANVIDPGQGVRFDVVGELLLCVAGLGIALGWISDKLGSSDHDESSRAEP